MAWWPRLGGILRRWRRVRSDRGAGGERIAARWLRGRGHRILGRNVRIAGVEVDLLVETRHGALALVEVKRRRSAPRHGGPVRAGQRGRLRRAAARVAARHPDRLVRIDLLVVLGPVGGEKVVHLPGALPRSRAARSPQRFGTS